MAENKLNPKGVRILLFGMPGSGKSSLLGALYQAAQGPDSVLGKISDHGGGLAELYKSVYDQQPYPESTDLTSYPITLDPADGAAIDAVLIDSDGNLAEQHLNKQGAVEAGSAGRALKNADALIFLVDPTKGRAYFDKEFAQFCQFVDELEKSRGKRAEIAGLPIYLVLSKCDAISAGQTGSWMQKIEEAKRMLDKKLQDNFARNPRRSDLPFGKTEVYVWATAVKKPAAQGSKAQSHEPYGVAELFRDCLRSAQEFYEQRQKAQSRLHLAVTGFFGLVAVMAVAAALFVATRPGADVARLESDIQANIPGQHDDWFKEPIKDRLDKLAEMHNRPAFAKLPREQQDLVNNARAEIGEYQKRFDILIGKGNIEPKYARTDEDLDDILMRIAAADPPEKYARSWENTKLVKKQRQFRDDIDNFKQAVAVLEGWYYQEAARGKQLYQQWKLTINPGTAKPNEVRVWRTQVDDFINRKPPLSNHALDRLVIGRFERTGANAADSGQGAKPTPPIFPELLNGFGTQAIWFDPRQPNVGYWLMDRDFARLTDPARLGDFLRDRRRSDKKFEAYVQNKLAGEEKADEKFERCLNDLARYSLSVSASPTIAYSTILRFQRLDEARKKLDNQRTALKKTREFAEGGI